MSIFPIPLLRGRDNFVVETTGGSCVWMPSAVESRRASSPVYIRSGAAQKTAARQRSCRCQAYTRANRKRDLRHGRRHNSVGGQSAPVARKSRSGERRADVERSFHKFRESLAIGRARTERCRTTVAGERRRKNAARRAPRRCRSNVLPEEERPSNFSVDPRVPAAGARIRGSRFAVDPPRCGPRGSVEDFEGYVQQAGRSIYLSAARDVSRASRARPRDKYNRLTPTAVILADIVIHSDLRRK